MVKITSKKKDPLRYIFSSGLIFSLLGIILVLSLALLLTDDKLSFIAKLQKAQQAQRNQQEAVVSSWQTGEGETYALRINEQEPGDSVMIESLNFAQEGWVVFHADDNGKPGVILSAYRFNDGEVKNWDAGLIDGVALENGMTYHAMIHAQNGDRNFNASEDTPLLDGAGNPMTVMFTVTE